MEWERIRHWLHDAYPRADVHQDEESGQFEVIHCGAPGAEYAALSRQAALVLSPVWAPILLEGDNALDYLQRRLSQSITNLPIGHGAHALQLGGDGRMLADLLVYRGADALCVLVEKSFATMTAKMIEQYVLADDVIVNWRWEAESMMDLAGPAAPELILALADQPLERAVIEGNRWIGLFTVNLAGLPCRIFGDGRWKIPYYHISIPRMALEQFLRMMDEACRRQNGRATGEQAGELARIESGIARFGLDTLYEKTIPLEAGLTDAISKDKGCYPGQEIIARITNLGHPAYELVRLTLEEELEIIRGAPLLHQDHEVGWLTSSVTWPGLGRTEGLGYLKWADRQSEKIEILVPPRRVPLHVQALKSMQADQAERWTE